MPAPNDSITGTHLAGLVAAALVARRNGAVGLAAELERRAVRIAGRRADSLARRPRGRGSSCYRVT